MFVDIVTLIMSAAALGGVGYCVYQIRRQPPRLPSPLTPIDDNTYEVAVDGQIVSTYHGDLARAKRHRATLRDAGVGAVLLVNGKNRG